MTISELQITERMNNLSDPVVKVKFPLKMEAFPFFVIGQGTNPTFKGPYSTKSNFTSTGRSLGEFTSGRHLSFVKLDFVLPEGDLGCFHL